MYIDLLSIEGKYRGISRVLSLKLKSYKEFNKLLLLYEKYLNWLAAKEGLNANLYSDSALHMLEELKNEFLIRGSHCEIIFFSDNPNEFYLGEGFLGFDAYWVNEGLSFLEEGCEIDNYFLQKLNENGLFSNYENAKEFCEMRMQTMVHSTQQCEKEADIRPFCIWN